MSASPEDLVAAWELRAMIARADVDNTLGASVLHILRAAHREIAEQLAKLSITEAKREHYRALLHEADRLLHEAYATAHTTAVSMLMKVDAAERAAATAVIEALRESISVSLVAAIPRAIVVQSALLPHTIDEIPLKGISFGRWWTEGARSAVRRVETQVQTGLLKGEHPSVIARRVFHARNSRTKPNGGIAWDGTVPSARMVMRTVATAVQARAALDSFRASGVDTVRFDAILDSRTSVTCAALDNTVWSLEDPNLPVPPRHPQCRSVLVPVIRMTRPDGSVMEIGRKRTDYAKWLKSQPETVQNKVLGRTRARMWRAGHAKLSDFTHLSGRVLRLDELASKLGPFAL